MFHPLSGCFSLQAKISVNTTQFSVRRFAKSTDCLYRCALFLMLNRVIIFIYILIEPVKWIKSREVKSFDGKSAHWRINRRLGLPGQLFRRVAVLNHQNIYLISRQPFGNIWMGWKKMLKRSCSKVSANSERRKNSQIEVAIGYVHSWPLNLLFYSCSRNFHLIWRYSWQCSFCCLLLV